VFFGTDNSGQENKTKKRKRKKWIMNSWRNSYGSRIVIHAGWVNELMGLMLDKKL
jgi:hypothetical protein